MEIKARIPGNIIDLKVKEGDVVEVRSVVCIMEAMKMEQPVVSPVKGIVKVVHVDIGDKVKAGEILVTLE